MLALTRTAGAALGRYLEKFFEVRRVPAGRPALQDWLEVLLWTAIFLAGALTAPLNAKGAENAPLDGWLKEHTGGGLCLWKRVTGIECPGCGLSRGFVQLEHGNVVAAVKLNPMTPVVFFLMAARLLHFLALCVVGYEVKNRIPWTIAWKFYGMVMAGFALLGVYRVVLRFI